MWLLGREVTVDGAALLLPLVGRAGARDVGLQVDAGVPAACLDPFAGLVRVDEVDDGFARGGFFWGVELRADPTARSANSATVAAYVVGAGFGGGL